MPAAALPLQAAPTARGWALLLALALIWGATFFLVEIALRETPPFTLVAHRVVWAALALWIYALAARRLTSIQLTPGLWGRWAMMGVLNNAIPFSLIIWGQTEIESGLAAILNAMTAIFGALAAAIFLADERFTAAKAIGAGLGVAGVGLIVGVDAVSGLNPQSLGQLAVLGATVSYALASVWGRLQLRGVPVEINALGMLTMSALLMIPLAVVIDGPPRLDLSIAAWASVLSLAVIGTAAAYLLYFEILRIAGAANTMLVTLMIPPVAIVLGAMFLGERLSPTAWIGFGVIAAGLAVIDGRLVRWAQGAQSPAPRER